MKPGKDYKFPGNMVLETALVKNKWRVFIIL
jgi:hypothetical protein